MASFRLDRISAGESIVGKDGRPSQAFQRRIQKAWEKLEGAYDSLDARVAEIEAAQAAADAAQATADTARTEAVTADAKAVDAQADATAAAREAARINSYPSSSSVLIGADAGTDASITIDNHTRVYPVEGGIDVPDLAITGSTISGLAFSTKYWVFYDDVGLTNTAPTFQATTTAATAQVGAAAGRHFVGYVTTPADGGTSTEGGGATAPGGTSLP